MEMLHTMLFSVLIAWAIVTAVLICVLIYRSMLGNREEDQLFLDGAGQSMAQEQQTIVARIERLSRPITALIVLSGALLVAMAGLWLWEGFRNF